MTNLVLPDQAFEKTLFLGRISTRMQMSKKEMRTFFVTLEFDGPVPYTSGDSFAIYPENNHDDILKFCKLCNLDPTTTIDTGITVYEFCKKKISLSKWTSKMSRLLFSEPQLPENLKELSVFAILKTISFTESLSLALLEIMPPIIPRYYSIASSPQVDPCKIDLLVSLPSFEVDGELKYGLASSFLCFEAALNSMVHGFVHSSDHFRIPHHDTPIIMIGPGTGVAPFKAFIQDRTSHTLTKNWLFFGERSKGSDFYFEEDFSNLESLNKLKLSLAFSRDQEHKIYVQDLMKQEKHELYNWIKAGAHIYVCGDAKKMARDVEQALIAILVEFESLDPRAALLTLRQWKKENRYNLDVY